MQRITVKKLNNLSSQQPLITGKDIKSASIEGEHIFVITTNSMLAIHCINTLDKIAVVDLKRLNIDPDQQIKLAKSGSIMAIMLRNKTFFIVVDLSKLSQQPQYQNCHMRQINCLVTYGNYFATGSDDMTLKLWEISQAQVKNTRHLKRPAAIHLAQGAITCLATYGSFLISGSKDKTLMFWNDSKFWLSHTFSQAPKLIFPCPSSSQILILTVTHQIFFVNIQTVLEQKFYIRGCLDIGWLQGPKICGSELNDEFFVLASGSKMGFIEVNLVKEINEKQFFNADDEKNTYITSISFNKNSLLCGINRLGVTHHISIFCLSDAAIWITVYKVNCAGMDAAKIKEAQSTNQHIHVFKKESKLLEDVIEGLQWLWRIRLMEKISRPIQKCKKESYCRDYAEKIDEVHRNLAYLEHKIKVNGSSGHQSIGKEEEMMLMIETGQLRKGIKKVEMKYNQVLKNGSFKHFPKAAEAFGLDQRIELIQIQRWAFNCFQNLNEQEKDCC